MANLNRHGFAKAEEAFFQLQEEARRDNITRDRERNEEKLRRLEELAEQRAAVMRAAGPFVAQPVDIKWLFSPHEIPETRRVLLPPEVSQVLVESYNDKNRKIKPSRVEYWRRQMRPDANGKIQWRYTHQGIALDTEVDLQDGQHRLTAAFLENFTLDINVSVGMPMENFGAIDVPAVRTASDTLYVGGITANPNETAGAARLVAMFDRYGSELRLGWNTKMPNDEIWQYVQKYGEYFYECVEKALAIYRSKGSPRMSKNALAAGIYLISRRLPRNDERVEEFLRGYAEGTDLPSGDARIALRSFMYNVAGNRFDRHHVPVVDQLAVFVKAWNAWVNGRSVSLLRFARNETMPSVFLPDASTSPIQPYRTDGDVELPTNN